MTINDPIPEGALLVDLRDREDYDAGHLPGACHMSIEEIRKNAEKDRMILLYCYRGMRSLRAAMLLKACGYRNARSIGGVDKYQGEMVR